MLLLLCGFISVFFSADKELAIIGSHRLDGFISYIIYAACYIGTRMLKNSQKELGIIRFLSIVTTSLCMDYFINGSVTSIFFNQNHFGYLLTLSSMLLCGLYVFEQKKYLKIIYIVMFCINTYTLININTFGCYLAVLLGLSFFPIFMIFSNKNKKIILQTIIVLGLFIAISIISDYYTNITRNNFTELSNDIIKITTNASDAQYAGSLRVRLWKHAFKYIKRRPFFGYGPEGTYYSWIYNDDMAFDRPHNEYIQCALFMGIPAALFYITGLILLFIHCMKNRIKLTNHKIIAGIAVFSYCISAFFGNTMFYTTPYFFMMLGMISNPLLEKK